LSEPAPTITFLSDYGLEDEYVGVCHAVIARRCPRAQVIDLAHGIPAGDVRAGAIVLRGALPFAPAGVHLAVVDPGVGGTRRAVAIGAGGRDGESHLLVGPDNGLLMPAAERLGGVNDAVALDASPERLQPVSSTFHGRDIFAPVAAALAAGAALADVGEPLGPSALVALELPVATAGPDGLAAHVVHRDRFGNLILDATAEQLHEQGIAPGAAVRVAAGAAVHAGRHGAAFADVPPGELVLYRDGLGMVALAVNGGSAHARLGLERGDELTLAPAQRQ